MSTSRYNEFKRDNTHKSEFKYVYKYISRKDGEVKWAASLYSKIANNGTKDYKTEREAAKAVDLHLIGKGKEPVNILVRK